MKNKIFTSLAVIGVALLFYFSVSAFTGNEKKLKNASEIQSNTRDTFTNCIFNTSYRELIKWGLVSQLHVTSNLNRFNDLNFNAVHSYDDGLGSAYYGEVNTPTLSLDQISNYQDFLDSVKDEGNLYGFFERSFLSYYCYGQRLIYEVAQDTNNKTLNFGFVYQKREIGNYEMDGNRTVIHAVPAADSTGGYLCKDIYENIQHSDLFGFRQNDKGTWFIKPVMRIPVDTLSSRPVVRIEVISFNGTPVDTIIITTDNFKDAGIYNGNYLEKYFNLTSDNKLEILGDTNSKHLNYGKGSEDDWQDWDINCKVDFRVFWYGKCEVWFDKMIVDDVVANELFDPVNQESYIDNRINQEVQSFSNQGGLYTFFTDEVFISQYPCIKYVVEKMRENTFYHPRFSLALTRGGNMYGMKVDSNGFRVLLDSIKPDFVQDDHHGFQSYLQKLPATITISDPNIPTNNDWIASSNSDYNQVLQHNTLGCKSDAQMDDLAGSLLSELVSVKSSVSSYLPTAKFIMQPQIHGWLWYNDDAGKYTGGSREPTNEEIQVQAMLSIAHGADGLCWFIYNSRIDSNKTTHKPVFYTIGMLDPEDGYSNRVSNCYGQNKWQYVSQMNAKINKWMDVLDNAEWAGGYSVHSDGANWEYINDIRSKAPYINGLNPCVNYGVQGEYFDCTDERYWEQGFYNPKDQSDKSKYFVMVNRRCVPPTQSSVGEVRTLRIKFNTLSEGNNWVLRDVYTNKEITFNMNNIGQGGYLNLGEDTSSIGYFKPGEGKLFQLIPVSVSGGTLVADETFSGNVTCNGMIYNGGHNITISPNAVVTFSDSAGIEMNGGCFVSGVNADNADDVTLTGKTETTFWKGITLIGCDSIGVYNTNITNIKANDTAKAFSIINAYKVNFRKNTINANSNSGGIQAVYNTFSDNPIVFNVRECTFNMNQSGYSAISILSNASVTLPIVTEWCLFNSQNDTSNAILFNEVTGGVIKNNIFTNFGKSVVLMYSTTDLYGNTILG